MSIKNILALLIIVALLSSCDYGPNMKFNGPKLVPKIYQYNISDSLTSFITEGSSPILLRKLNKLLYIYQSNLESEFRLYNFVTENSLMIDTAFSFVNDFSLSPNEDYISFISNNQLKRINLNSLNSETLFSTTDQLINYPPPQYSMDGKFIICLFNKLKSDKKYYTDSLYINIYDIDKKSSIQLDTAFLRNNDAITVGFTNDSKKFYFSREGYNPNNYLWQIELTIFNNDLPPTYFNVRRIFPASYESSFSNYDQSSLIVFENYKISFFNLISGSISKQIAVGQQFSFIKNIRDTNYLIGINKNIIYLMNINGNILNSFRPDVEATIVWADYFEEINKILFRTEEYNNY